MTGFAGGAGRSTSSGVDPAHIACMVTAMIALTAMSAATAADCIDARILSPATGAIVADPRPRIIWLSNADAKRYRVLLRSQVPNGPVLQETDTWVTETQFTPARPIAVERANVNVRVIPDCASEASNAFLAGDGHRFAVDPLLSCPAPTELDLATGSLRWHPSPGARSYEVAIFGIRPTTERSRTTTTGTSLPLPGSLPEVAVAAVRARCNPAVSGPAFVLLR